VTKVRTVFRCGECGAATPKWAGRCPGCDEWNTLIEEVERPVAAAAYPFAPPEERAMPIVEIDANEYAARPTGVDELDRVLGGGLVPGSVTLLGGEPGIGKSTLLLQALAALASGGTRGLLISAEESRQQVRLRAERLGALHASLWLVSETGLPQVLAHIEQVKPDVCVIDSIQSLHDPELGSAPGSVTQVRECAHELVRVSKASGLATVLVGHVTKEGALAGPRVLEHVVDTVLSFEGDRHHALRLLRALKHRFGPTSELGLFEMHEAGLAGMPDAGLLFLADRRPGVPGSVVVPTVEGHRPLLVELQALVGPAPAPAIARRSAQGLDAGRLALLLAVLDRRVQLSFSGYDVYASAVGGVRVVEPGADLALALALASALTDVALPDDLVACGEVGLAGEIRQVSQTSRRLTEAARLGFRHAVVPRSAPDPPAGIHAVHADTLGEAIGALGLHRAREIVAT
jgi:DNA repair protein RadA/Sms